MVVALVGACEDREVELRELSYFVAVAEEASFTRGARRVHVVQSAASAAVGRLERQLGVRLFERTPGALALTAAGRMLLTSSQRLLAETQRMSDELQALGGHHDGVVEVGTVLSTGTFDIIGALAEFRTAHPRVAVHLNRSAGPMEDLLEDLALSRTQLMLVPAPRRCPPEVRLDRVGQLHQLLTCRTDHALADQRAVTIRELDGQTFVDFPCGWGNRSLTDALFADAGVSKVVAIEVQDVATAMSLVRRGVGIAFLPGEDVVAHRDLTSIDLLTPPQPVPLFLAMGSLRPQSPSTLALHKALLGWADSTTSR